MLQPSSTHELGQLGQATGGSTVTSAEALNGYGSKHVRVQFTLLTCIYILYIHVYTVILVYRHTHYMYIGGDMLLLMLM